MWHITLSPSVKSILPRVFFLAQSSCEANVTQQLPTTQSSVNRGCMRNCTVADLEDAACVCSLEDRHSVSRVQPSGQRDARASDYYKQAVGGSSGVPYGPPVGRDSTTVR